VDAKRRAHHVYSSPLLYSSSRLSPTSKKIFSKFKTRRRLNDVDDSTQTRSHVHYLIATPVTSLSTSTLLTNNFPSSVSNEMEKSQAEDYLTSLLNKTLRVTTTDTRMFLGQFKCTDSVCLPPFPLPPLANPSPSQQDRNIILSQTFEYRLPSPPKPLFASDGNDKVVLDMTSRYMGLVVVPGEYIERIEVEEFESQVKGRKRDLLVKSVGAGGSASEEGKGEA
jgi:N-alpha-acetyltransferase 38, NatC auxiliary subunit